LLKDDALLSAFRKQALVEAKKFHINKIVPKYEALYERFVS